ncbi:hypothetical protein Runsl_5146 [Runella slithyformis DSM 19594]|uniref:Uncharacterized protein n=1 Tax=Runella slithyformis (strain ATCC 29530 / DSM 19594 / LMG 11500 / NCIMB 11436 / LSU 4) TaxID=761193 RepID=A0A7U3ZQD8_RUNSL|nr:hypothetical protein Runsl_5146 [Runella slithyformis DSM 19594]
MIFIALRFFIFFPECIVFQTADSCKYTLLCHLTHKIYSPKKSSDA